MWGIGKTDRGHASLMLKVDRIVEDVSIGMRSSFTRGRGMEFIGYREHQSRDSHREIAWRASARLPEDHQVLSQNFAPERHARVLIVADEGVAMRTPSAKAWHAKALLHLFAKSSFENRDPCGVIGIGGSHMIFSGWLESEEQLEEFFVATNDEYRRREYRSPVPRLSLFLEEETPQNTLIIFITDLAQIAHAPVEDLRSFNIEELNVRSVAVVLDEWWGFSPVAQLITMEHPQTGKQVVADMREGGDISKEAARFYGRVEELKRRGRPFGLATMTVPLAAEEPFREFCRQWLRHFEE